MLMMQSDVQMDLIEQQVWSVQMLLSWSYHDDSATTTPLAGDEKF